MLIRSRKGWELPGLEPTPESTYVDRRRFLRAAGAGALALLGARSSTALEDSKEPAPSTPLYPAKRNEKYTLDRELTEERWVRSYNNFYEFGYDKTSPRKEAQKLETSPWKVEFRGLLAKELALDLDDLVKKFPLEERLYRFRCVEAWAMAVPWTGIPLRKVIDHVKPTSAAKYVRFVTFHRPEWAPNQRDRQWPWPYHEGLTIDEATNELAMLVTGLYGKPLPKQNGAPVRLVVPWKYGFKSIKSVVRIEFLEDRPKTFWSTIVPEEYGFYANVNPNVPHPRWSQETERMLGDWTRRPTLLYNGYAEQVAGLYEKRKP